MLPEFLCGTTIHVVTHHGMWNMVTARQEGLFAKRIGKALAKQRIARNLTQEQVAAQLGVEQETISRFERGATLPPLLRLIDLAEIFDVPLDALVRAGSARSIDQAIDLAGALNTLSEEDRVWVLGWVTDMCAKLATTAQGKR
ncbi:MULTISPECIES: helix-turn-helix domain-containing protein [unclassified Duganella]|uniref:helix-turn-helix domain-containing protein n=1 Tax=unclassified Duganella TaxID=2636909 RepID=UPI001E6450A8|nr:MULTISPECIES: helix-turn-helix transcriptional regulator [unclassified Duganella]